jgi:uncharacterized protein YqeY
MSDHKSNLSQIMKTAMKEKDKDTLGFARNLHAAVRKKEIDDQKDLDDSGFESIVSTQLKQRRDGLEQFKKGGRDDLAAQEEREIKFLEQFLPPQLSDEELEKIVSDAVAKSGATTQKEMGKVMGILMPLVKGKADGKKVNQLVRSKLEG